MLFLQYQLFRLVGGVNLYLSMLDRMGIKLDVFGDSTGELQLLSDI